MAATYVIFDGDEDKWAYAYMKGWKKNENVNFDFEDAHDPDEMTGRAQNEDYVKRQLRERMKQSRAAIVLIGDKTKNLYRYIRWELELAQDLGLPIIGVNLNGERRQDKDRCPPIIRDTCVVHVAYAMKIIGYALSNWPGEFVGFNGAQRAEGARYYNDNIYRSLGL